MLTGRSRGTVYVKATARADQSITAVKAIEIDTKVYQEMSDDFRYSEGYETGNADNLLNKTMNQDVYKRQLLYLWDRPACQRFPGRPLKCKMDGIRRPFGVGGDELYYGFSAYGTGHDGSLVSERYGTCLLYTSNSSGISRKG